MSSETHRGRSRRELPQDRAQSSSKVEPLLPHLTVQSFDCSRIGAVSGLKCLWCGQMPVCLSPREEEKQNQVNGGDNETSERKSIY